MNINKYQAETLVNLLDRMFAESDEYRETKVFADDISTDDLEELWMFREKLVKYIVAFENSFVTEPGHGAQIYSAEPTITGIAAAVHDIEPPSDEKDDK
tara:strand:+ start:4672 stop:4968 length:297 start_codon:yes stop_codon:yes gene_type:complete